MATKNLTSDYKIADGWIGTSFCERAIDKERFYVSGKIDDKSGNASCFPFEVEDRQ